MDYTGSSLGVLISGNDEQRHAGFLLQDDGKKEFVHLAWHKYLFNDSEAEFLEHGFAGYIPFDCPTFSDLEREELVSFIKTVYKKNMKSVPYSIIGDGSSAFFNLDGSMPVKDAGLGLTCATFVMSIFSVQSYPLIDESSWLPRADDKQWHMKILDGMRKFKVDPVHISVQEKYIGIAPRFRPEEVIGCAANFSYHPHRFCSAVSFGEAVLSKMRAEGLMKA